MSTKRFKREAVIMQMTWVGAPTIYYGDEAGVCGFTDPDNRRTYPWGKEDKELIAFHKEMVRIHKEYRSLQTGSLRILSWDENILSYGRFRKGGADHRHHQQPGRTDRSNRSGLAGGSAHERTDGTADVLLSGRLYNSL